SVNGSLRNSVDMIKFGCARLRRALSLDFDNEARQRRAYLSSPLAGLLQFFDFAFDNLALERRHAIKKNDAVAVVRFVQHAARGELSSVQLEFLSINVMRAHDCSQLALDAEEYPGKGQTTFIAILLAFLS